MIRASPIIIAAALLLLGCGKEKIAPAPPSANSAPAKSERQQLIDAIASGEVLPAAPTAQLREIQPDAVPFAILAGAAKALKPEVQLEFVELLAEDRSPAASECLRRFAQSPSTILRLKSLHALHRRGDPSAFPALLRAWKQTPLGDRGNAQEFETALAISVATGEEHAIQAIHERWAQCSPLQQARCLEHFATRLRHGSPFAAEWHPQPFSNESRIMCRELLEAALTDQRRIEGNFAINGRTFENPSLGELAQAWLKDTE